MASQSDIVKAMDIVFSQLCNLYITEYASAAVKRAMAGYFKMTLREYREDDEASSSPSIARVLFKVVKRLNIDMANVDNMSWVNGELKYARRKLTTLLRDNEREHRLSLNAKRELVAITRQIEHIQSFISISY